MKVKYVLCLFLLLGIFFTFRFSIGRENILINVQGRAELLTANIQKGDLTGFSSSPIEKCKIFAILGKVKSTESEVVIPIKRLSKKKLSTYTNSDGVFNFRLKPGIYTFFIVQKNHAYLNSFDGKGSFKSYEIFSKIDDIVITVTSESYF